MVEATIALLEAKGVPEAPIYFDKFHTRSSEETGWPQRSRNAASPSPVFTDARPGPRSSRPGRAASYNYFTPRKRRATVLRGRHVDVQPDPARHLTQGWVYAFANGDAGYPKSGRR
jgi:hypothetical protein